MQKWLPKNTLFYFLMKKKVSFIAVPPFSHVHSRIWDSCSREDPFWRDLHVFLFFHYIVRQWSFKTSQKAPSFVVKWGKENIDLESERWIPNFERDTSVVLPCTSVFQLSVELEEKGCIIHSLGHLSEHLWPFPGCVLTKHLMIPLRVLLHTV